MLRPPSTSGFDPATLGTLQKVYDDACRALADSINDSNRKRVHEALATAIFDLAMAGQVEADRLLTYAVDQARRALVCINEPSPKP